nr:PREDICTED: zinc finger protein 91-like isoform X1 [Bemisia tabaci]XP_018910698.1 PREDICTED: zinc finger protein 91-like isoform X1 [Bemisia tabaci]XP_018910699.1 PREDICTED: zinc finger protein 91-like isoform X1 [Bemisia tabaci]
MAKSSKSVLYQNLAGESLVIDTKSSSYRDVILQKVKLKYTEAVPSFSKRIEQRFAVDKLVSGQCRICGLKEKSCCKIFETDETLSKLVNTYMPITVHKYDVLPLNVCLECLGTLQTIDDLAYRCYLTEACLLQHYKDYKDTSIFLDPIQEEEEKPYTPLHLRLPRSRETPHLAATVGFPARRKGSSIHGRFYTESDKIQETLNQSKAEAQISLNQQNDEGDESPTEDYVFEESNPVETMEIDDDDNEEKEVVKNCLKANLHKILLGGNSTKRSTTLVSKHAPISTNQSQSQNLSHDHAYSHLKPKKVSTSPGANVSNVPAFFSNSKIQTLEEADAVKNIATEALAELDKNSRDNRTLLNLSEILNTTSQELDEPVYIILVNDEDAEKSKQQTNTHKPKFINLAVDTIEPPETNQQINNTTDPSGTETQTTEKLSESMDVENHPADDDCQVIKESETPSITGNDQVDEIVSTNEGTGVNPDEELAKFSESLQTEQIKRWFTIQILKTPNEGEETKDEDEGVMLVTYVVYYSKINNKLVPHHFSLMNDSFTEVTRRRAYSIISTMLKEEKNRVLQYLENNPQKKPQKSPKPAAPKLPPKKPFRTTCCFCNKTMKEQELTAHSVANHMVRCKYCRVIFTSKDELILHECEVHEKKSTDCETCNKKFYDEEDKFFCSHNFNCSICKKQFTDWNEYLHHEKIHANSLALKFIRDFRVDFNRTNQWTKSEETEKVYNFGCSTCGKKFESMVEMERCDHLYDCRVCKNQFSNYPLFVTHGCIHNPELLRIVCKKKSQKKLIVQCGLCEEQFHEQKDYLAHYYNCMLKHGVQVDLSEEIKALQTNSPVNCIFCGEYFKSIFIFELHYNQCFKINSTECDECDAIIPSRLRGSHLLYCDTKTLCDNCGTTFPSKKLYRQHLRQQLDGSTVCITSSDFKDFSFNGYISEGFDPNNCHICGKIFVNGNTLDRHVKSVHLGLEKSCPLCGVKFQKHNSITMFLRHRKTHPEDELKDISCGESYGSTQCPTCEKWFSSRLLKLTHEIYYHDKILHKCEGCETEFLNLINLRSHETKCKPMRKDRSVYTCEHCEATFPKVHLYYQHLETHDITYTCEECGKTFKKKTNLSKHKETAHTKTPTICDVCGREFSCEKYCKIHKRNLHGDQSFLCQICGKTFHNSKRLKLHASVHSGLKPYKCRFCEKSFRTHTIRNVHEDKHKNDFRYECNFCQHKFSRFINLYVHKRKVHADKCTYQCSKCGCGYNDVEFFTNHQAKCGGKRKRPKPGVERATWCPYCDKTFGSAKLLKAHYSQGSGDGNFVCSNGACGKRYDTDCSLKMHERVHAVDKFQCKHCKEAFLGLKQLELHSQLQHNDKFAFHCTRCGRGYMFEKFLEKHVKYCNDSLQQLAYTVTKSKKPIVRCENCGLIFAKFKDLRVHMTLAHGSETYKDYQCLICDSQYDSYIQLSKHSKHHFKDATNPGSYCCPKCKIQSSDWEVMMNHVCGSVLPKRGESSRFGNLEGPPHIESESKLPRKSPRKPVPKYDSDDDYVTPQSRSVNSRHHAASSSHYSAGPSYSRTGGKSKPSGRFSSKSVVIQEDEYASEEYEEEMPSHPIVNEDANLIYHCSFCSSNFDHIQTLQKHLTDDHNLSLNSLEFQLVE